jgi:endonuclease/exonuclease/phosphatase (EEP) superfamily protein YafD
VKAGFVFGILSYGWLAAVVLLIVALRYIGEHNPATAALLYAPPMLWLLPGASLGLIALVRRHGRHCLASGIGIGASLICLCGWQFRLSSNATSLHGALVLTLLTHNTGEAGKTSLRPFKDRIQPDLLLLQSAVGRARRYLAAPGYEEFPFADDIGEFTLVSRYPILSKALIERPQTPIALLAEYPVAARFEIEVRGRRIAIYSVHAFTPRSYVGGRSALTSVACGLLGFPGTPWSKSRSDFQTFWDAQISAMTDLRQHLAKESIPYLVAGDFNAPPQGVIHRIITDSLQDVHAACGNGCGFTFPGATRSPLSGFGPWLRLDYVLASPQWQCISSTVEPSNPSQHRALAATVMLPPSDETLPVSIP